MNAIVIFLGRPSCKRLRDGSLFTAWGGGRTKLEEMTSFLGEQKGGSVLRGDRRKRWKDSEGEPLKFAWKIKTCGEGGGGSRKSSKVIRGDHFSEVTFKAGIG